MTETTRSPEILDVLVLGAGLSGVGAACHLRRRHPGRSLLILERRHAVGGTWDLFRYPGVRSDSDMLTFGYRFRPWRGTKVLADGASIRDYIAETAREHGVDELIRFGRRATRASWDSEAAVWTVEVVEEATGRAEAYRARFLVGATGYYNYDAGYRPAFPDEEAFEGTWVHPQHWPEDLDWSGKRVVVIGSGATAITLVPAMARDAEHVTMLQRSPTYVLSVPAADPVAALLERLPVPESAAYAVGRVRNILLQRGLYDLSRKQPALVKRLIRGAARAQLGDEVDLAHFTPRYQPWDERLCVVPNGDLFRALRKGHASVVTDHIAGFTPTGIRLASGEELPADIVVTATGLDLQLFGGIEVDVDGEPVHTRDRLVHKGVMMDDIPNAVLVLGYTNASWTLKADLVCEYLCRLLDHMDRKGYRTVVPRSRPEDRADESVMGGALKSGYVQRADAIMPRQGVRAPWKVLDNYLLDTVALRRGRIADEHLRFDEPAERRAAAPAAAASA